MGIPTSEVSYTSAKTGRGDHEVHKGHVVALEINLYWYTTVHGQQNIKLFRLLSCLVYRQTAVTVHRLKCTRQTEGTKIEAKACNIYRLIMHLTKCVVWNDVILYFNYSILQDIKTVTVFTRIICALFFLVWPLKNGVCKICGFFFVGVLIWCVKWSVHIRIVENQLKYLRCITVQICSQLPQEQQPLMFKDKQQCGRTVFRISLWSR
jgi:hypothetical protein